MKIALTGSLQPGSYLANFTSIEPTEPNQFGPGFKWSFTVSSGPCSGQKISRTTGQVPSQQNQCGRFLIGLSGKSVLGEAIDLTAYLGKAYLIVIGQRPEGGPSLDSVSIPPIG